MPKKRSRVPRYIRQAASTELNPQRGLAALDREAISNSSGLPQFYEERKCRCVDCGKREIWTAEQQKRWYEVDRGSIYSKAFRCQDCLQKYRLTPEGQTRRPPRRIEADLSAQAPNNSYDPPRYYEDRKFRCVDCGKKELWTAEQQKWWYEVAKGTIYSSAVRCRACRQQRRAAKEEQRRKSEAGRK